MWEWSHTIEGIENVRDNINKQSREWLETVYAEWIAAGDKSDENWDEEFDEELFKTALVQAKMIADDSLADYIMERAEDQRLCDNGGHEAYCCPYACGCHAVSFSKDGENTDE